MRLINEGRVKKALIVLFLVGVISSLFTSLGHAQVQDGEWSEPYRLSSRGGEAGEPIMASDEFGFIHLFWKESGFSDNRTLIQYARFDGETWSSPVDIYITWPGTPIIRLVLSIDNQQMLHLFFTTGNNGPIYHIEAPAHDALSAQNWSEPSIVDIPANRLDITVGSGGVIHLLYSNAWSERAGIYYVTTGDQGLTWSKPYLIDSDNSPDLLIGGIRLVIDEKNRLHALWYYNDSGRPGFPGTRLSYSRSIDNGNSWSSPISIDEEDEEEFELRLPVPTLSVFGDTVHVIWPGNSLVRREHRFSLNAGGEWSETQGIFGYLHGVARGDGAAFDADGRLHFVGQLRWPQGLYHAYWDNDKWTEPELIYLIARDDSEPRGNRIHAHNVRMAISSSNHMVVAFTTSPSDLQSILYVMQRTLSDIELQPILSTPTSILSSTPTENATTREESSPSISEETSTVSLIEIDETEISDSITSTGNVVMQLVWGFMPVLLVIGLVFMWRLFKRHS